MWEITYPVMIISEKLSVPWPQLPPFMGHSCIKTQIWISRFRTICFLKQRRAECYLLTEPLSRLSGAHWVKCRNDVSWTVRKIFAAGHRRLVDGQRIRILKDWIPAQRGLYKTAAQTKTVCITFGIYSPNLCKVNDNQILLQQDNNRIRLLEICGDTEGTIIFNT